MSSLNHSNYYLFIFMLLICLDILNIHFRLFILLKDWYLWHLANIYCFACLFLGRASIFWQTDPHLHMVLLETIRKKQNTAHWLEGGLWGRPYKVSSIILLIKQMKKLRHWEVLCPLRSDRSFLYSWETNTNPASPSFQLSRSIQNISLHAQSGEGKKCLTFL